MNREFTIYGDNVNLRVADNFSPKLNKGDNVKLIAEVTEDEKEPVTVTANALDIEDGKSFYNFKDESGDIILSPSAHYSKRPCMAFDPSLSVLRICLSDTYSDHSYHFCIKEILVNDKKYILQ